MSSTPYLIKNRHGTVWVCRIVIPKDIRHLFKNRREIRRSTFTNSKSLAFLRASVLVHEFKLYCEEVRVMAKPKKGEFTFDLVTMFDAFNKPFSVDQGGDKCKEAAEREIAVAEKHRKDSFKELQELHAIDPELVRMRMAGVDQSQPTNVIDSVSIPFRALVDEYLDVLERRADDPTVKLSRSSLENDKAPRIRFWGDFFELRLIPSITKKELLELRDCIYRLPTRLKKRDLSVQQGIQLALQGHEFECIAEKTAGEYIRDLRELLKYAYETDRVTQDNSDMLRVRISSGEESRKFFRRPFETEELNRIFESFTYVDSIRPIHKDVKSSFEGRYWLPILSLFTGARLEELCQLRCDDVYEFHGYTIIDFNDSKLAVDGVKKKLKNKNSIRKVPIHPKLIEIGFLEYWKMQINKLGPDASLLNITKRGTKNSFSSSFTRWFSQKDQKTKGFLEKKGIESSYELDGQRHNLCFHSFRHTLVDELREKEKHQNILVSNSDIALIVGHIPEEDIKLTTREYGKGKDMIDFKYRILSFLDYSDIDLPTWTPKTFS